jgi:hypothetical protein
VVLAAAVVVTVAVVVAGLLMSGSDGGSSTLNAQTTTASELTTATTTTAPTTTSRTTPTTTPVTPPPTSAATATCDRYSAGPAPQTPEGWKQVVGPRGLAYDVPPEWEVNKCTSLVGWEKKCDGGPFGYCPIRSMSGSASLDNSTCLDQLRAVTGLPGAKNTSNINDAVNAEAALVKDIYTSDDGKHAPTVSLGSPRELTVNGRPAVQVVATVTDIQSDDCTGPAALHSMVATTVSGQEGSVLFVISLEQGYPGAPDPSLIDTMVGTLRRAAHA